MQTLTKITLPSPCNQQWNNMTAAENGRFCNSCNKTVIDFTTMTNQQIIDHLSVTQQVCGRITTQQFTTVNNQLKHHHVPVAPFWRRMLLAVVVLVSAQYAKGQSKVANKIQTEQGQTRLLVGEIAVPAKAITYKTITGRVIDETGTPVAHAFISCGKNSVLTNLDGLFKLEIPAENKVIEFKSIGYEPKTIKLKKTNSSYDIKVKVSSIILGGMGAVKRESKFKTLTRNYIAKTVQVLLG